MTNDKGGRQKAASFSLHLRRILGFCLGSYLMGLGIAMTANSHLGNTPISSLPYVCSFIFPLSFGMFTFIINVLMFVGQKVILGPAFGKKGLLQLPAVFVFSLFIDLNVWLTQPLITDVYALQLLTCVGGTLIMATGISLSVMSNFTILPGDGLVLAIAQVARRNFGRIKVIFDCTLVSLAFAVSLLAMHDIVGLREGTVISAILTGNFIRMLAKPLGRLKPLFADNA